MTESSGPTNSMDSADNSVQDLSIQADIDPATLVEVVTKKTTCPFIGSAVGMSCLPVLNNKDNPLASIEKVRELGNTGGGDLGDLLVLFASGNHARMRGPTDHSDQLGRNAPEGLFSLEFPGSQGSHRGHSGILQGNPTQLASGRFSQADFDRLAGRATKDGFVTRSEVANFIAENLHRDTNAKVIGTNVLGALSQDLGHLLKSLRANLAEAQSPASSATPGFRTQVDSASRPRRKPAPSPRAPMASWSARRWSMP